MAVNKNSKNYLKTISLGLTQAQKEGVSITLNEKNIAKNLSLLTKKIPQQTISYTKPKSLWSKPLTLTLLSLISVTTPLKALAEKTPQLSSHNSETPHISIPVTYPTQPLSEDKIIENSPSYIAQNLLSQTDTTTSPETQQNQPPSTPNSPQNETSQEPRVLVSEVLVTGVDPELTDLVYNTIRTTPGRTTTRSRLQEDINAIYATGFFRNVRVTPEDTQYGVRITYQVEANPVLQKVEIQTLPEKTDEQSLLPPEVINEAFAEQYGQILNLRDLQEGIAELNKWYTDNGYDLAQVVGAPQISEQGVVTLIIAEGQIADIQVKFFNSEQEETNGRTRDFIVTREMKLKPGDIFNRRTAQQDLQRVFGLGIFEDVKLSFSPAEDPSEVVMNVEVVETNTGSLAAGAGISSTSGIFGTVSYQERNLGGNNQTVGVEFQLGERELLFDLSYQDPWIAGDPYRTSYTGNIFRRRSISLVYDGTDTETIRTEVNNDSPRVVRTGAGISFSRPLAKDPFSPAEWVLSTGLQYQHIEVQDADGDLSPRSGEAFGSQKLAYNASGVDDLITWRFNASQDTRNNGLTPTSGSLLLLGTEQTLPGTGILFNRVRASYSYYIPLKLINFDFTEGPQTLAFNFQGGTVLGDLPPYEAFVIGGSNSVRGYGEGDLGNGRSYFQATAEYRFPIISFVGGALFFDYGTTLGSGGAVIGKPAEVRGLNGDGFGYGLGVRVQSPVGPIRIDYAINDEGDSRIHFGIGEKF
ncbi:BamA/TamA family outer membrane protein [Cyanobacterium sp. DS4]|uniref:BamA/TamA family outer membrane protein n=1 Tax=Cyanobacterium sp. DS4 TaxID=2878255 RepID=UPI002E8231C9|nr:BamA/TamA family outer membrane protein [Cyanobacterium sp. Dongsha4]WVL00651.1 BamA/TamA family outer membrane protein [Cyanobacterium sp. Dongsha4]